MGAIYTQFVSIMDTMTMEQGPETMDVKSRIEHLEAKVRNLEYLNRVSADTLVSMERRLNTRNRRWWHRFSTTGIR